jgi:hypothetical protein
LDDPQPHNAASGNFQTWGFSLLNTNTDFTAQLLPLNAAEFNCFDIDEDDPDTDLLDDTPKSVPLFDATGYGSDTFEKPVAKTKTPSTSKAKSKKTEYPALPEYTTPERRIKLLTRIYEPSDFDKSRQSAPPANDNQQRKHTFPALDEARNNTLMVGNGTADTLLQNEWAFDILLEVRDLIDAATPASAWLQHDGHGEADEHEPDDKVNSGYGPDVIHDYGPSEDKVKWLWEHGNDDKPSKDGDPWNLGPVGELTNVISEPSKMIVKALHTVGALEINERNQVTHFKSKRGKRLKFKTKTRQARGTAAQSKTILDPIDISQYDGARLPRNKRGELNVGFFGGRTASSNSTKPNTLHYESGGPAHTSNDPWAATMAEERARDDASIKLSQCRLLVGEQPYQALFQAASGHRIGELCGGRLGNTTDSARGRNLLQVAIERIIEVRKTSSQVAA